MRVIDSTYSGVKVVSLVVEELRDPVLVLCERVLEPGLLREPEGLLQLLSVACDRVVGVEELLHEDGGLDLTVGFELDLVLVLEHLVGVEALPLVFL